MLPRLRRIRNIILIACSLIVLILDRLQIIIKDVLRVYNEIVEVVFYKAN